MLDQAYAWVCTQRLDRSHNNSIWDLRYNWNTIKPLLQRQLMTGQYLLNSLQSYCINDDWAIMVKTKHQLRKVIKLTHKILNEIKLKMQPGKTFLGCIKKGFDFLGVHFGATPTIATSCQEKHRAQLAQRYAQGASAACSEAMWRGGHRGYKCIKMCV